MAQLHENRIVLMRFARSAREQPWSLDGRKRFARGSLTETLRGYLLLAEHMCRKGHSFGTAFNFGPPPTAAFIVPEFVTAFVAALGEAASCIKLGSFCSPCWIRHEPGTGCGVDHTAVSRRTLKQLHIGTRLFSEVLPLRN